MFSSHSLHDNDSRYQDSMRRRASKRIGDDRTIQLARQSSLQLSQRLLQEAKTSNFAKDASMFIDESNIDDGDSIASSRTDFSNERAVMRGVRMGQSESRERRNTRDSDFTLMSDDGGSILTMEAHIESDAAANRAGAYGATTSARSNYNGTSTVATTNAAPKDSKSKRKLWRRRRNRKDNGSIASTTANENASEAWMCGVCGKAFATYEACDKHEEWHVQAVCVSVLGEDGSNGNAAIDRNENLSMDGSVRSETRNRFKSTRQRLFTEDESFSADNKQPEQRRLPSAPPLHLPAAAKHHNSLKMDDDAISKEPWEIDHGESVMDAAVPMTPPSKQRTQQEVRFNEFCVDEDGDYNALLGSAGMDDYSMPADEALVSVCQRAQSLLLTNAELKAERNLALLSRDKAYYDDLALRAIVRRKNPYNRFRSEGDTVRDKVHNKLLDAYQIMKQGDNTRGMTDQYNKINAGNDKDVHAMTHSENTLYVNVMVKNSVQVVKRELERLAKEKWERPEGEVDEAISKFQRFRVYAHVNMVKLAGLALASDFTPRRIAIQLSNDLYRLLTPRLKRRGVAIETEIEYRVGGYFVLAVNILAIDWQRLMKANVVDVANRLKRWKTEELLRNEEVKAKEWFWHTWYSYFRRLMSLTRFDVLTRVLSLLYYFHWIISVPICWLAYHSPLATTIRMFILSSVTDEIFFYVEQKGMEMEIRVLQANSQASFMLQALREIRAGGRELKKKRQETEAQEVGLILGNYLGPTIKADKEPAPPISEGFKLPENLKYISLEVELPVGFRRLRWALLSDESKFTLDVMMKAEGKYENITINPWERYSDHIGKVILPDDVKPDDFVGVSKEQQYLMPKSAFVSANMAYDTVFIAAYNDNCFAIKKKTHTPDVPFGGTFFSWTMLLFENLGGNSVKMTCSVEAEFPNGPPMIARQIESGLRGGTAESFVSLGETITKYSEAFP